MTKGQKSADTPPLSSGASDVPVDAAPPTRRQLRLQQQQRAGAPEETSVAAVLDAPPVALNPVREGGRRDRRRRAELEARAGLQAQARNQAAAVEAIQAQASGTGDAERPAGGSEPIAPVNDPAAAHNLAMVTPLEFVQVPGMDRPVMKRPPTSHVPVVTSAIPVQSAKAAGGTSVGTDSGDSAPIDSAGGAKPVGARSAFGLDPLDVLTAGLGRTRRLRFVSLGIGGLGLLALAIAVVIIVGGSGS